MARSLPFSIRRFTVALAAVLTFSATVRAADPAVSLKVVTDREDAIYKVGEEAAFLISVSRGGAAVTEGSVSFVIDDFLAGGKSAGLPE